MIGSIGGGWLADRFHIKWVVVCMYALGGVFLYMITLKTSTEVLYFIIAAVGACSTGAQIVVYAYSGQYYRRTFGPPASEWRRALGAWVRSRRLC